LKILRILLIIIVMGLSWAFPALADTNIEAPGECSVCGMDRAVFAHSRTLIRSADGKTHGFCCIHCAAKKLLEDGDNGSSSLQIADYGTRELIEARSATWVVGGDIRGVMTSLPKWAFARDNDARLFLKEHGGTVTPFTDVLKLASAEITEGSPAADSQGHTHNHGSSLLANPAFGDDTYHTHPAGMWMANYKFMHTAMKGLRDGTNNVSINQVIPMNGTRYGYMMAPTRMTMDMHMVMLMYGLTDRFTLMGMGSYVENSMDMVMNMGGAMGSNKAEPTMKTRGVGDTELRGMYRIHDTVTGSLGVSIPTGDIDQKFTTMGMEFRAPYDMQLGSGTFDLKPAITCNVISDDARWNWGGQAAATLHLGRNDNQYALGDSLKLTGWLQRTFGPAAAWLRLAYSDTGRITGEDPEIRKLLDPAMGARTPDADPHNYGGKRLDGFMGVSYGQGPVTVGVEVGLPLYQDLNGLQLKTDWYLTAGIQAMF